jgi:hypothetical protein
VNTEPALRARQASDGARECMMAAFVMSARLECVLWDSASRLETWPP